MVPEIVQVTTFINGLLPSLRRTMDCQGAIASSLTEAVLIAKRIENADASYYEAVSTKQDYIRHDDFKKRFNEEMINKDFFYWRERL